MKTEPQATGAVAAHGNLWRFAAMLALFLLLACTLARPKHYGDVQEYMLTTVALANHASPDIRPQDIAEARAQLPAYAPLFDAVGSAIASGADAPQSGVLRGRDGFYAMHFFAYPALAALPYKLLRAIHVDPFRCYQLVNGAAVFVLGLALFRLFRNGRRAWLGVLLYLLCGGMLYWQWSSPETLSAAGLLAGLLLFCTGAPLNGGLLAGLGATQNPPLILFCAFAPLLRGVLGKGGAITRREVGGLAACAALALLPAAFDLVQFGTPSIIGELATDPSLVTVGRLHSFFFDLNQGVVLGIPALAVALLAWRPRDRFTWLACAFAVAMALPSLAATNWNSGAAGIMRYALWASMPLLFALLWQLAHAREWPRTLVIAVIAGQALAMAHARSYTYTEFSPLARTVMAAATGAYNPEPEIFFERAAHKDGINDIDKVYAWPAAAQPSKLLFHSSSRTAAAQLCGEGYAPAADVEAGQGWRYINGPANCVRLWMMPGDPDLVLGQGWSKPEHGGGMWEGVWSDGASAHLLVRIDARHRPLALTLDGHYHGSNRRTRVTIDGKDLGWQALDQLPVLPIPAATQNGGALSVDLEFDAPATPAPGAPDQRRLAFFLHQVTLRHSSISR